MCGKLCAMFRYSSISQSIMQNTYMTGDQREIIEEIRPIEILVFMFHLEYHRGDCSLQIIHSHYDGLQGRIHLFLFSLHRVTLFQTI